MRSRSCESQVYTFPIAVKFESHLGSNAAETSVKCQSDTIITIIHSHSFNTSRTMTVTHLNRFVHRGNVGLAMQGFISSLCQVTGWWCNIIVIRGYSNRSLPMLFYDFNINQDCRCSSGEKPLPEPMLMRIIDVVLRQRLQYDHYRNGGIMTIQVLWGSALNVFVFNAQGGSLHLTMWLLTMCHYHDGNTNPNHVMWYPTEIRW